MTPGQKLILFIYWMISTGVTILVWELAKWLYQHISIGVLYK